MTVEPSELGSGTTFIANQKTIPACPEVLVQSVRATDLAWNNTKIKTVEHLLAALVMTGSMDAKIVVEGPEIPILDGSALPWFEALADSKNKPTPAFVNIEAPVQISRGSSHAKVEPILSTEEPSISVFIDFDHPKQGSTSAFFRPRLDDFFQQIAPARTFAFENEVSTLKSNGLALGGSLGNALVIGRHGPLNEEGLRVQDEPVKHKLLDAIGDLSLLGGLPWAKVELHKPGHGLHHDLVRQLKTNCMGN